MDTRHFDFEKYEMLLIMVVSYTFLDSPLVENEYPFVSDCSHIVSDCSHISLVESGTPSSPDVAKSEEKKDGEAR